MEQISPAMVIIGFTGIISFAILFVQTAIEDIRIVFVALSSQLVRFLLTTPGTNGAFLVGSLFALAVLMLMAPVISRNIKHTRFWAPLLGITVSTLSVIIMYVR